MIRFHCRCLSAFQIKTPELDNIMNAHKLCIDPIPIYLHINSYGGIIFDALTAIDVIKACKVPVYTIIEGATASAGTLISVVGDKRFIRPNAHMLIHQLSSGCWGKMMEIEDDASIEVQASAFSTIPLLILPSTTLC